MERRASARLSFCLSRVCCRETGSRLQRARKGARKYDQVYRSARRGSAEFRVECYRQSFTCGKRPRPMPRPRRKQRQHAFLWPHETERLPIEPEFARSLSHEQPAIFGAFAQTVSATESLGQGDIAGRAHVTAIMDVSDVIPRALQTDRPRSGEAANFARQ